MKLIFVALVEVSHLDLGPVLDILGGLHRRFSENKVFLELLSHEFESIEISELSLLVVHYDLLLLLDAVHYPRDFLVEVYIHCLDVILVGLFPQ